MVEKTILDYLAQELSPVPVTMEIPESMPNPVLETTGNTTVLGGGKLVVIEKTGSSRRNHLCTAMLAIQSYGPTLLEAAQLNEQVKAAMYGAVELNRIARVELNSDYNFTDETTKRPRYQAVFDITHYE